MIFTNDSVTQLDNPVYMSADVLMNGSMDTKSHVDLYSHIQGGDESGRYMTISSTEDASVFVNDFASSSEDLLDPPTYSTLKHF